MRDPALALREAYDHVMDQYGDAIGQRREELVTPALVLDIDAAQRNIDRMAGELRQLGRATIRPHYKTHKSPDLARRQLAAGAGGLSMATVWEAAVLAAAGMDDLLWSTPWPIRPSCGHSPSLPQITGSWSPSTKQRTPRRIPRPPSRQGQRSGSWSRSTPAWTGAAWIPRKNAWHWPGA